MFNLQNITKSYGNRLVLDGVSLSIGSGDVIALIGDNGSGKTTLLEIMSGNLHPDSGAVASRHETVGYVPQDPDSGGSVRDSFGDVVEDWRIPYALSQVSLEDMSLDSDASALSGGQKTRLALAHVLALDPTPSILVLDEPTNNLDVEGLDWLAQFIKGFRGGVLLVSHDRVFINEVATGVVRLEDGKTKLYGGNYDFYKQQKEIERQSALQKYEASQLEKKRLTNALAAQQEKGQHTHKHIKRSDNDKYQRDFFRNRVASKFGQQARSLETRLEKIEVPKKPHSVKRYGVSVSGIAANDKLLVRLTDVGKEYDRPLLRNINLDIRSGDRIQLAGPNGCGKSTLLKIVVGLESASSGEVVLTEGVKIGYLSQEVDGIDMNLSALENLTVLDVSLTDIFQQARSMDLTKDDLQKLPHELSRGQQSKLALTKLLLRQCHILVLDEPTNHMDISTRERLESALVDFDGALLIASHDRYFSDAIGITKQLTITNGELL